jgi:hypothetical protein
MPSLFGGQECAVRQVGIYLLEALRLVPFAASVNVHRDVQVD